MVQWNTNYWFINNNGILEKKSKNPPYGINHYVIEYNRFPDPYNKQEVHHRIVYNNEIENIYTHNKDERDFMIPRLAMKLLNPDYDTNNDIDYVGSVRKTNTSNNYREISSDERLESRNFGKSDRNILRNIKKTDRKSNVVVNNIDVTPKRKNNILERTNVVNKREIESGVSKYSKVDGKEIDKKVDDGLRKLQIDREKIAKIAKNQKMRMGL